MNNYAKFEIFLKEPNLERYVDPPDDPLGEFTDFENGIRLFCYECDRVVLIRIGDEERRVFLDPDISMIFEELPTQIVDLSEGKPIEITFAESCLTILKFTPNNNTIACNVRNFGYSTEQKTFQLHKSQVLEVLTSFVAELISKAVTGGYIKASEAEKFLNPIYQQKILPQNI
jgi:hypothetical protein